MIHAIIPIIIIGGWLAFSIYYVLKANRNFNSVNPYIFESIPSVFPTLGILCTFIGVTLGLWDFDTKDIEASMPELLNGLKLAFFASMAGIAGLFVFQKITARTLKRHDDDPSKPKKLSGELEALIMLNQKFDELNSTLIVKADKIEFAISEKLINYLNLKLGELHGTSEASVAKQLEQLMFIANKVDVVQNRIIELTEETKKNAFHTSTSTDKIIVSMEKNNGLLQSKFDEFSELLRKNNTEALVGVMKKATEEFNSQMSELINKLVQENFKELNNSVQLLNQWQNENKEHIQKLTQQFSKVSSDIEQSSNSIEKVAVQTRELVKDTGKLDQLVQQLNRVLIDDTKFSSITNQITSAVEGLNKASSEFEESTYKLNQWIVKEIEFKQSAELLIRKLEEFRDFNGGLWDNYRKEMSQSVGIIKQASSSLKEQVVAINDEFYERLNTTFENLDELIQRVIKNYN